MIQLFGNRGSGNSNKVEYTAIVLGIPYEYKEMDFQKDLKTPQYLKIHPAGMVPSMNDDGFILFESGAMCKYLCDKKPSALYPLDMKKRAIVNQWIDFSINHIATAMGKVAYNRVFAAMRKLPVNEMALEEGLKQLDRFFPIIEAQLAHGTFLTGNELTLADLTLFASLQYGEASKVDLSKYSALSTWQKKLMSMDFYKKVHQK